MSFTDAIQLGFQAADLFQKSNMAFEKGVVEARQLNFAANVERRNALLAKYKKQDVQQAGVLLAGKSRSEGRQLGSEGLARAAASGVASTEGSVGIAVGSPQLAAEMDAYRAEADAARQAWGIEIEILSRTEQAENLELAAHEALLTGSAQSAAFGLAGVGAGVAASTEAASSVASMYLGGG